jgi:hypothetical protein
MIEVSRHDPKDGPSSAAKLAPWGAKCGDRRLDEILPVALKRFATFALCSFVLASEATQACKL